MSDSRTFVPSLVASLDPLEDGRSALLAPSPGTWREAPASGSLIRPGDSLGWIEILGVAHRLLAPEGTLGIVVETSHRGLTRPAVDYGAHLLTLDPEALSGDLARPSETDESDSNDGAMVFRAPTSGRFYRRPAPDKPNFVEVGQVIERGQTLGLLEVMKTFTRINYDDPKLPAKATVAQILAEDQQDLASGAAIVTLTEA